MSLLLVELPLDEVIGLDFGFFRANNSVCAIVELTTGAHYLYLTRDEVRYGHFVYITQGKVIVLQASKKLGVAFEPCTDEERYIFGFKRGDFNSHMGRLSNDLIRPWKCLTEFINKETIDRLQPLEHASITSSTPRRKKTVDEYIALGMTTNNTSSYVDPNEHSIEVYKKAASIESDYIDKEVETFDGSVIYFTQIPGYRYGIKHNNSNATDLAMDKTWALDHMIKDFTLVDGNKNKYGFKMIEYKDNPYMYIIAEFQFAFVCLLMGHSYEGLNQWKELFKLLSSCDSGISIYPEVFIAFGKCAYYQMAQLPGKEDLEMDNFIIECISNFREIVTSTDSVDLRLLKTLDNIEKMIKIKFGIELEDLSSDGPVIVDI